MGHHQQFSFMKSDLKNRFTHGGVLRKKKSGRGIRPFSSKDPLHVVFKADRKFMCIKSFRGYRSFDLIQKIIKKYANRFYVKVEQISIQDDHIHMLIRCQRRSQVHHFFRVVSGQIAQNFRKAGLLKNIVTDTQQKNSKCFEASTKLWKYRPFSRVVKSWRAYRIARDYIRLNELEARGVILYNSFRLRGLSEVDWHKLWV